MLGHRTKTKPGGYRLSLQHQGEVLTASLSGRLALDDSQLLPGDIGRALAKGGVRRLVLDLAGLDQLDSVGALNLRLVEGRALEQGLEVNLANVGERTGRLLELVTPEALSPPPPEPPNPPFLEHLGEGVLHLWDDTYRGFVFLGELTTAVADLFRRPRGLRGHLVLHYMEKAGVDGLPIVAMISALLGMIMAFMSALQLQPFGAAIYVASLVAVAMVRELGPIITAILVAGRSGSAFAAEIGTMIVNEEVDALVAMGFNPYQYLAVPKILAAMAMVPLLTFFADFCAILGGMLIGVSVLDLTVYAYITNTLEAVSLYGLVSSTVKSAVFGLIIGAVGCQRGFRVRGGALEVGAAATRAVVSSIFLVILTDSLFALVLYYWWA
jgi:phospholipid/cholesterol/gamma-HCH transport system permease protein